MDNIKDIVLEYCKEKNDWMNYHHMAKELNFDEFELFKVLEKLCKQGLLNRKTDSKSLQTDNLDEIHKYYRY